VHQGLRRIRAGKCIAGITALLEIAGRNPAQMVAADLGFSIGPRLNAAGRLEDMSLGIECLLTDNLEEAREFAKRLNALNEERRHIESEMQDQAFEILKTFHPSSENIPDGICLFDKAWHQGVIGILASRIKDRFHRPVIAFALANENELKGSARSISGVHIRDVLADVATHSPDLIQKFGGHAMAAGLSILKKDFEKFSQLFSDMISKRVNKEILDHCVWTDGELSSDQITLELALKLHEAGPWGQGFPEPLFDGIFTLIDQRIVGNKHLKMVLANDKQMIDAIMFNVDINQWPNHRCQKIHAVYSLDVNEFRGTRRVQLIVKQMETT